MCCQSGLRIIVFFSSFFSLLITECSHSFRSVLWRGRREGHPNLPVSFLFFLVLLSPPRGLALRIAAPLLHPCGLPPARQLANPSGAIAPWVDSQYVPPQVVVPWGAVLAFGTCSRSGDTRGALRGARTSPVHCPYRHSSADCLLPGKGYLSVSVAASSSRHFALARGQARDPPGCPG